MTISAVLQFSFVFCFFCSSPLFTHSLRHTVATSDRDQSGLIDFSDPVCAVCTWFRLLFTLFTLRVTSVSYKSAHLKHSICCPCKHAATLYKTAVVIVGIVVNVGVSPRDGVSTCVAPAPASSTLFLEVYHMPRFPLATNRWNYYCIRLFCMIARSSLYLPPQDMP